MQITMSCTLECQRNNLIILYDLIRGDIKTRNTQFREAISTEEKMAVRLNETRK
jgi:hypothetical protein